MAPVAPARYNWTVILLSSWLIGGLFLDGWAHNHVASLETFFTPWHAVLYSGYAALAALYFVTALRNRGGGAAWPRVMPVGYQASLVGAIVFGIGGGLDLLWHTIFGIERSVDALLSPTHLVLATGIILMVTGPLRAAWRKPDGGAPALRTLVPAILSISYLLASASSRNTPARSSSPTRTSGRAICCRGLFAFAAPASAEAVYFAALAVNQLVVRKREVQRCGPPAFSPWRGLPA